MTRVNPIQDLKGHLEPEQVDRLVDAAGNPRDKALISLLPRTGILISEAVQLEESNINFAEGTLTIIHLKERSRLRCPNCRESLGKKHLFCPSCGNKVEQALREKVEQRRKRIIPVDGVTLALLKDYLRWRRQFPYRGPLVFPFTRQRGWQLVERIGRRAGIKGLHPNSLRHLLATTWVSKGLDVKKLQVLLSHASIATKLWESKENEEASD